MSTLTGSLAGVKAETTLGDGGLGVDSLEVLQLAAAVNEMFHLHETSVEDYLLQGRAVGDWAEVVGASWVAAHDRISFKSSGSTGTPKKCVHRVDDLWEEINSHASYFQPVQRILSFVPSHHIYGFLFTGLLPAKLGIVLVDCRLWPIAKILRETRAGDLLIATPTLWEFVSRSVDRFEQLVRGVTSTAPCPAPLFAELEKQNVQLTEIYGSSETAGIARRSHANASFALLPFWVREGDALRRVPRMGSTVGETSVPSLALLLPDNIEWVGHREFQLLGRIDGAVQVGGLNVYPEHVAARLAAHPSVRACAVRLMTPREGDRLKAFVVWRHPEEAAQARIELESWIRSELSTAERPVNIATGPELPRNDLGKEVDWVIVRE